MTTTRTYSSAEVAGIISGAGPDDQVAVCKVKWLEARFRGEAKPDLSALAFKVGREWRVTADDVPRLIDLLRPRRVEVPVVPVTTSMTRTSRRRLAG